MPDINKDRLREKIIRSRDLTALEKRYLEKLLEQDESGGAIPAEFKDKIMQKFCERR